MEPATRRRMGRARDLAGQRHPSPCTLGHNIRLQYGREQGLGVGVARLGEQGVPRGQFDQPSQIHHGDAVADVADDDQVVRHKERRHAVRTLQIHQQIQNLRPH